MRKTQSFPIDFVVLWVDGSDPKWLAKKKKYKPELDIADEMSRFRDWGMFKYWFRSVEQNAPWVNQVYLVTDNQIPEWLNLDNPKLTVIDHADIIDKKYLPTFNSQAIELNIHRIPGLSEHFVYFNDDTFLGAPTKPEDFFKNGKPREIANINPLTGMGKNELYVSTSFNNALLMNRHFSKKEVVDRHMTKWINVQYGAFNFRTATQLAFPYFTGYKAPHLPSSLLKTTFDKVWKAEYEVLLATTSHKFRDKEDVNQNIITLWQLCENNFYPKNALKTKFAEIKDDNAKYCEKIIHSNRYKQICLNDNYHGCDFEKTSRMLCAAFEKRYPNKSSFERDI